MSASLDFWLALTGGLLGFAAGWLIERSHFCTMGAISDAYLFGSWRRLRAWGLAIATALLLTQGLAALGLLALPESRYLVPRLEPLALFGGGLLFGIGMVLAGGCASRNLVRLGAGSLKALVVMLVFGVTAAATLLGFLAWPAGLLRGAASWSFSLPSLSPGGLLGQGDVGTAGRVDQLLGLVLASGLLALVLKDRAFRRNRTDLGLGLGLGVLVALGFLATGRLFGDAATSIDSLTYVTPTADGLLWAMGGSDGGPGLAAGLVLGTIAGAAASAARLGRLRLETFVSRDDMIRHLGGGALMGFGGILALGCTIGQGMSGLATLSLGSFIAMGGIVLGALIALRRLERGSWRAAVGLRRGPAVDPAGSG